MPLGRLPRAKFGSSLCVIDHLCKTIGLQMLSVSANDFQFLLILKQWQEHLKTAFDFVCKHRATQSFRYLCRDRVRTQPTCAETRDLGHWLR